VKNSGVPWFEASRGATSWPQFTGGAQGGKSRENRLYSTPATKPISRNFGECLGKTGFVGLDQINMNVEKKRGTTVDG